ncbi:MAG: hypothetical protein WD355_05230 [Balneolaceae bacterium]
MKNNSRFWWERKNLEYSDGRLHFAGMDLSEMAEKWGTPLYLYDSGRSLENIRRVTDALQHVGVQHQILYAMKANRNPDLLKKMQESGLCGIDACSPGEVLRALECGFSPGNISVTACGVSERDWEVYQKNDGIMFNVNSISSLKRITRNRYRSRVGIRLNPSVGVGYHDNEKVRYSGKTATKFGVYEDRVDEALEICKNHDIRVTGLHMHTGSGFLGDALDNYRQALTCLVDIARELPGLEYLNIGGGLGVPLVETDKPLNLEQWAGIVADTVGQTGLKIIVEPGNYISKDSGLLLCQIVEIDEKGGAHFTYLDAGCNVHPEPAYYSLPMEPVTILKPRPDKLQKTTLAGNINEALDKFYETCMIDGSEGDLIALINGGAYGKSMVSNHCMRGHVREILL